MTTIFEALAQAEKNGDAAVLCTVISARGSVPRHVGSKMLVYADGRTAGTVGGGQMESRVLTEARAVLADGQPRRLAYTLVNPQVGDPGVCGGEVELFVEPVQPIPTLLVIGGGHIGKALVHLGHWLGFRVVLSDDRPEFCNPEAVPGADEYLPVPVAQLAGQFHFHSQTYVVMPTRGMPVDVDGLPHLLDRPHAYLGVIGSRRRWLTARQALVARGVAPEKLAQVRATMGLELNAETPEEIALSILAEIIMVRRGGTGTPMAQPASAAAEFK